MDSRLRGNDTVIGAGHREALVPGLRQDGRACEAHLSSPWLVGALCRVGLRLSTIRSVIPAHAGIQFLSDDPAFAGAS